MSLAQTSPVVNEDDGARSVAATASVSISARDAGGGRARPTDVSEFHGPAAPSTKLLTAKEQAAAEEAKEKLERMVKVRTNPGGRAIIAGGTAVLCGQPYQ